MKRFLSLLLGLMLLSVPCLAEEELSMTEIVESVDLDQPESGAWDFPVALEDQRPGNGLPGDIADGGGDP